MAVAFRSPVPYTRTCLTNRKTIFKTATVVVAVAVVLVAVYIMFNGLGLADRLDFGAGAYYYADIPDFEKFEKSVSFKSRFGTGFHILLFLLWGFLMYRLWVWIDKR